MINYFEKQRQDYIKHAQAEWPKESVGVIQNDVYIPLQNEAEAPEEHFIISPRVWFGFEEKGEIQALVHSHNNYPHASADDQRAQIELGVPFGIVNLVQRSVKDIFFWGDALPIQDLLGRPFHMGVYDCFKLTRDYFRLKGITTPNMVREFGFWNGNTGSLMDNLHEFPFRPVELKEVREHDVLLYSISKKVLDHIGVVLKNGLVLHHFVNKLSGHWPINYQRENIVMAVRYRGEINE